MRAISRTSHFHIWFLAGTLSAIALVGMLLAYPQPASAQVAALSVSPNPVTVGAVLRVSTNPTMFAFTPTTVVWLTPTMGGVGKGYLVANVVLCGTPAGANMVAGGTSSGLKPCMAAMGGGTLVIPIPAGPQGDLLMQVGLPQPSGYWNLHAMNLSGGPQAVSGGQIRFVGSNAPPPPPPPPKAPNVANVYPACVNSQPSTVTINADGSDFDPNGAQAVVAFIYYASNGRFRTDFNGRDSRVAATMLQRGANHVQFSIDLQQIHRTGGDNMGLGGNYYVQVQNPDGRVSGGQTFFTAQPYRGAGHC